MNNLPTDNIRYEHGDIRDDGAIFVGYARGRPRWKQPWQVHCDGVRDAHRKAKGRAAEKGVPFEATLDDFHDVYPRDGLCKITGEAMTWGSRDGRGNSPSIDRIVPALGYVRDNIQWISSTANTVKGDKDNMDAVWLLERSQEMFGHGPRVERAAASPAIVA